MGSSPLEKAVLIGKKKAEAGIIIYIGMRAYHLHRR